MGNWYKSEQDGGIEYYAIHDKHDNPVTVDRVLFDRYNGKAGVRELVSITWQHVFKWADFDECGGLGVALVKLTDGSECFASGRYFANGGGLAAVHVGCYGDAWLKRSHKIERDKHGFPVRKEGVL